MQLAQGPAGAHVSLEAAEAQQVDDVVDALFFEEGELVEVAHVVTREKRGVGHDGLASERLEHLDDVVVHEGFEHDERIADDADARAMIRVSFLDYAHFVRSARNDSIPWHPGVLGRATARALDDAGHSVGQAGLADARKLDACDVGIVAQHADDTRRHRVSGEARVLHAAAPRALEVIGVEGAFGDAIEKRGRRAGPVVIVPGTAPGRRSREVSPVAAIGTI